MLISISSKSAKELNSKSMSDLEKTERQLSELSLNSGVSVHRTAKKI